MAAEIFARLAIYLTQVGVALLLSLLLWNLSRIYQQAYIRSWFVALLAFAAYQLAILLQWLLGTASLLMQLLQFITRHDANPPHRCAALGDSCTA